MATVKGKKGSSMSVSSCSKSSTVSSRKLDEASLNRMIQERAYYIWESKGKPQGKDMDIWIQAKKEITAKFC